MLMSKRQIGNYIPALESNTRRNWVVTGDPIYNILVGSTSPSILEFGIDTEGGDRAKTNSIRKPIELLIKLKDGAIINSSELECEPKIYQNTVEYSFSPYQSNIYVIWKITMENGNIRMDFEAASRCISMTDHDAETRTQSLENIELIIPFDPKMMGTNIISENWGDKGSVKSPLIINALDMGQLVLNCASETDNKLNCKFIGSRATKRIDLYIEVVEENCISSKSVIFTPVYLEKPSESISDTEWKKIRRGLLSLLQCTPYYPQANGWNGSPGGIVGNNVISDPVSCSMRHNLRWIAGMGEKCVLAGVNLNNIVKYTIEYWLNNRMNEDGSIDYVLEKGNISADSNTGVLNSAGDYFNSTNDVEFVKRNINRILRAVNYFVTRDLEDDGLFISFRDGNGNRQFGDTAYDTISSGYKTAVVNAQAYKAYLDVAKMMKVIGREDLSEFYVKRAIKLRKAFNQQFYDEKTGLYYMWVGKNGIKHQYIAPVVQATAVIYGLADYLEIDAGIKKTAKDIMKSIWNEFNKATYYDSKKQKQVRYVDLENRDFTGFYWGIPNNLLPVPPEYNYATFGEEEFPFYCNGGIFPQDTTFTIEALNYVGMKEEANIIKSQIYKRQHEGILENGSGFYMGVVNILGTGYSIMKWDGTPTDYEGIISRDCSFLENTLWLDPEKNKMIYENSLI